MYLALGTMIFLCLLFSGLWYSHISKKNKEILKLEELLKDLQNKQKESFKDYKFREDKYKLKIIMIAGNISDENIANNIYQQLKSTNDDAEFFSFYNISQMKLKINQLKKIFDYHKEDWWKRLLFMQDLVHIVKLNNQLKDNFPFAMTLLKEMVS